MKSIILKNTSESDDRITRYSFLNGNIRNIK